MCIRLPACDCLFLNLINLSAVDGISPKSNGEPVGLFLLPSTSPDVISCFFHLAASPKKSYPSTNCTSYGSGRKVSPCAHISTHSRCSFFSCAQQIYLYKYIYIYRSTLEGSAAWSGSICQNVDQQRSLSLSLSLSFFLLSCTKHHIFQYRGYVRRHHPYIPLASAEAVCPHLARLFVAPDLPPSHTNARCVCACGSHYSPPRLLLVSNQSFGL